MSQLVFSSITHRYAGLDAKNDPLLKIDSVVWWEDFRPHLEAVGRKPANQCKLSARTAGTKGWKNYRYLTLRLKSFCISSDR